MDAAKVESPMTYDEGQSRKQRLGIPQETRIPRNASFKSKRLLPKLETRPNVSFLPLMSSNFAYNDAATVGAVASSKFAYNKTLDAL